MKITTTWFNDQFNVSLASKPDADPFLTVKGVRIKQGSNGEFVAWPSQKKSDGTYWKHCFASDAFNEAVLAEAKKTQPKQTLGEQRKFKKDNSDDDIPF